MLGNVWLQILPFHSMYDNKKREKENMYVYVPSCPSSYRSFQMRSVHKPPSRNYIHWIWHPRWIDRVSRKSSLDWSNFSLRDPTNRSNNRNHISVFFSGYPRPCLTILLNSSGKSRLSPYEPQLQIRLNLIPYMINKTGMYYHIFILLQ